MTHTVLGDDTRFKLPYLQIQKKVKKFLMEINVKER